MDLKEKFLETYKAIEKDPESGERHFNVPVEFDGDVRFKMTMDVSKHVVFTDSPAGLGGTDKAASPLFLTLGAIGACIGTVIMFWSRILDIKIDDVKIFSRAHINLAGLLGIGGGKYKPGFDQLEPIVEITSNEEQAKIDQLMEKVNTHCPIFFNLRNESPIEWKVRKKQSK
jgi:uncharacterized OsmC-like protein